MYLVIVFAFSWPFQLAFVLLGDPLRPILLVSMIMAGVGTFVAGRYVFRDGFEDAGWRWGQPRHYVLAFGLALLLWLLPVAIEKVSGLRSDAWEPRWTTMLGMSETSIPPQRHASDLSVRGTRGPWTIRLQETPPSRRSRAVRRDHVHLGHTRRSRHGGQDDGRSKSWMRWSIETANQRNGDRRYPQKVCEPGESVDCRKEP
jgi:hypothetical protein